MKTDNDVFEYTADNHLGSEFKVTIKGVDVTNLVTGVIFNKDQMLLKIIKIGENK